MDRAVRDLFPIARMGTYLNSAAVGPIPTSTIDAVTAQLNDVAMSGSGSLRDWLCAKARVRRLVAESLGGSAADVAFTRNTSDGFCAIAAGIDWQPGDNIVSIAEEFPANFYPWRCVRDRHGVELRLCGSQSGSIDLDEFCLLIDGRTKLVSVSAVQYANGLRIDLERIGRVVRKRDALFAVDIIQAFGAMPLDLPNQFVDLAAGASYKWLCAPEGCGIFYANDRARERIPSPSNGWTAVEDPWDFAARDQPIVSDARQWETGMGGTALLCGVEASLKLMLRLGIERIERHLLELTDFLCEMVPFSRYRIASSRMPGERSQIVSLAPTNGQSADEIESILRREGISVSSRSGMIRVSPHLFNTFDDIERFATALP